MSSREQRISQARSQWRDGDAAGAERALREIVDCGDTDSGPHAACVLGLLFYENGQFAEAKGMYQRAIDSGHPIQAQRAALALGMLLTDEQDLAGASPVLLFAGDGADPDVAGRAHALLAQVLHSLGDLAGAHAAREKALRCGDPDVVSMAAEQRFPAQTGGGPAEEQWEALYAQATSLWDQERYEDAKPVLARLIGSGHADYGSLAAFRLYSIHAWQGDLAAAKNAAEHVIALNHPTHVGRGYSCLGGVLQDLDDPRAAIEAYRRAARDTRPDVRLHAIVQLGLELAAIGEFDEAQRAYQQVIDTGHPRYAVEALGTLAELQRERGDIDGAIGTFGRVAASDHDEKAPLAAYNVGVLLHGRGDTDAARQAFAQASESEDADLAHHAAMALAMLEPAAQPEPPQQEAEPELTLAERAARAVEDGDVATARSALASLTERNEPVESALAALSLGLLEAALGNAESSRSAFDRAIRDPEHRLACDAAFLRALLDEPAGTEHPVLRARFQAQYNEERGTVMLAQAIGDPDRGVSQLAATLKAEDEGGADPEGAAERLTALADSEHPLVIARANHALARLYPDDESESAFLRRAVERGHRSLIPWIALDLGRVLLERGADRSAREAFEIAAWSGVPTVLATVFGGLMTLYTVADDPAARRSLCTRAIETGDAEIVANATFLLGMEWVGFGDLDAALALFDEAVGARDVFADLGAFGAYALRDEFDLAQEAFTRVAEDDDQARHRTATRLCLDLAHQRMERGEPEFTGWALRLAAETGHDELAQEAWLFLGAVRNDVGDHSAALAAWRRASGGDDPEQATKALQAIAYLQRETGDLDGAAATLSILSEGTDERAGHAAHDLGALRADQEDFDAAIEAFTRAEAVAAPDTAAHAARRLGALFAQNGDLDAAATAFERAIGSDDQYVRALSAWELGNVLSEAGDRRGAESAYERALASDHPDITPLVLDLRRNDEELDQRGWRLLAEGDPEGAREALTEHHGSAAIAEFCVAAQQTDLDAVGKTLGELAADDVSRRTVVELGLGIASAHFDAGNGASGTRLLRAMAEAGDPETTARAQIVLGTTAENSGDRSSAVGWYRRAMGSAVVEVAAGGAHRLARLLLDVRDQRGAEQACRHAMYLASGWESVRAAALLGQLRAEKDDPNEAAKAWDRAEELADSDADYGTALRALLHEFSEPERSRLLAERASIVVDPDAAAAGLIRLAELAQDTGDHSSALERFREAAGLIGSRLRWNARFSLALLLADTGDIAGARAEFERLGQSEEPFYAANGELGVGLMLADSGERIGAAAAFARSLAWKVPEVAESALTHLRDVLSQQRDSAEHANAVLSLRLLADVTDRDWAAQQACELGAELAEAQDAENALPYLRCAVELGGGSPMPKALLWLGQALESTGDVAEAQAAYEQVRACDDSERVSIAEFRLFALLRQRDGGAADALARAGSGVGTAGNTAPDAEQRTASDSLPDVEPFAERWFEDAPPEVERPAGSGAQDATGSAVADYALAQSLRDKGDFEAARTAYLRAVEAKDPKYSGEALLELGSIGYEAGDDDEAYRWYSQAAEAANTELAAKGAMNLAMVAKRGDDLDTAEPWLLKLIRLEHPTAPAAAAHLAEMYYWRDEMAEAIGHYQYALDHTDDPEIVAESAYRLGEYRYLAGEVGAAETLLRRAVATEYPGFAEEAAELLAKC